MRDLLADLLAYSEAGADPEEAAAAVDLNARAGNGEAESETCGGRGGSYITVQPLPVWPRMRAIS